VSKRLSRSARLLLVAGCAVATLVAAFLALGYYMRGGVGVTVEDISIARQDGADSGAVGKVLDKITGAAKAVMGQGDLTARLNVKNNTALSLYITSARYSIFWDDKEIGRGNWVATEGAPAAFRSHEDVTLELPFRLDSRSVLASVVESLGSKDLMFRVEGDITVSLAVYDVTVPFTAIYTKVELPRGQSPTY
jgi:LEA14-like dessication related protein